MTRSEAIARVAAVIPAVLTLAGIAATDTAGNMKEPVDAALLAMGVALGDLPAAESADAVGFVALAKHHALLAAEGRIAAKFDVGLSGNNYQLSKPVATVQIMIARSEKELIALFGTATPGGAVVPAALVLGHLQWADPLLAWGEV